MTGKRATGTITHVKSGDPMPGATSPIVVIGEPPYAEMKGDRPATCRSIPPTSQRSRRQQAAGMPVVVVLFSGRPLILEPILDDVDALIAAWLPGTEGEGIADVLFGRYNPTGKLSVTWPQSMSQIPINAGPKGRSRRGRSSTTDSD